jgi:Fe2+ or Zn2+ uptake regulation protein
VQTEAKSLRNTQQRRLVLDIVRDNLNHPTADEVYEYARKSDTTISKGTVYRNLNVLSGLREIKKLPMPLGPDHYDFNMSNHYHFICRRCGKVVDTEFPYLNDLNGVSNYLPGYEIEWHRLVLVGTCPECGEQHEKL